MKTKLRRVFRSFSARVTLIFVAFMLICSVLWAEVFYMSIKSKAVDSITAEERSYLDKCHQNVNNIEEVVNMTIQMIPSMNSVINYVEDTIKGTDFTATQKLSFKNNELKSLENISNLNPYLYNVRLFVNSPSVTCIMPCFYDFQHMENLSWYNTKTDNKWIVDYKDNVYPDRVGNNHLVGKTITKYNSTGSTPMYVIEVSTEMTQLFPDIYVTDGNNSAYFVDDSGEFHANDKSSISDDRKEVITKYIDDCEEERDVITTVIDEKNVVVSIIRFDKLNGWYVHITDVHSALETYYKTQNVYIFVVIFSLIISLILVFFFTTKMFKRFNIIQNSIMKIESGQTDLRIKVSGNDEISDMAKQINSMLDRLQMLNVENTTRQLIVKNTEIKAMQNQINAHFMYNVLESIKMMAEIQGQYEISDAVTSLGQMFRYSVKWTSGKVALSEEVTHIKNYLSLMNLRLDNNISLGISVPEELLNHKIPKMALQPLVENAVLHGVEGLGQDSTIYVKSYVKDDLFFVEISDSGRGMSEEELQNVREKLKGSIRLDEATTHGLALKNVQNRIKMYYGDEYGIDIYSSKNKYTKVVLRMPFDEKNSKKNN